MSEDANPRRAPADPVAELEARLGLRFADRAVALAALTHKSYVNEHRGEGLTDNERLEFLGDAVIDLAVSQRLMARFPAAREGDLSKMRAAVVDETGLSEMARALGLGALLRLGRGEELTGGRDKASLLADAMEAVVAALFLGSGLDPVFALVDRFLGDAFQRAAAGTLDRDFKTQLQELAQSRFRATPRYRVVAEHGPDHSKTFEVELELRGEVMGRGKGRSKKDAEQAAAKLAYEELVRRCEAAGSPVVRETPAVEVTPPDPVNAPAPEPVNVSVPAPEVQAEPAPEAKPTAEAEPEAKPAAKSAKPRPKRTRAPAKRASRAAARGTARARARAGKGAARVRKPAPKRAQGKTRRK